MKASAGASNNDLTSLAFSSLRTFNALSQKLENHKSRHALTGILDKNYWFLGGAVSELF